MWLSLLRVVATIRSFLLNIFILHSSSIVVFQSLCLIQLFVTPWTAACQAPLSSSVSWSLFQFRSIESVMVSNHHILCCPLLLLLSIFPSIRVFSNELALHIKCPKYWRKNQETWRKANGNYIVWSAEWNKNEEKWISETCEKSASIPTYLLRGFQKGRWKENEHLI